MDDVLPILVQCQGQVLPILFVVFRVVIEGPGAASVLLVIAGYTPIVLNLAASRGIVTDRVAYLAASGDKLLLGCGGVVVTSL